MTVRQYKNLKGLTLEALTNELRVVEPRLDMPLVSRMVNDIIAPNETVQMYINLHSEGVANESARVCDQNKPPEDDDFLRRLYREIFVCSRTIPASRAMLAGYLGVSDRVVRKGIEELRRRGYRIVSLSGHYGYWLDTDGGGYEQMRSEMRKKALSILSTIKAMDDRELEGQLSWDEVHG